jgi:ubiquinone/menaquinone biosynthesis C-methylase UbiE
MRILGTTEKHKEHWKNRKIDWVKSYLTGIDEVSGQPMWNHPHRQMLSQILKNLHFLSLWEVGCGAGANLMQIFKTLPGKQIGGSDINPDAIESCRTTFIGGRFHVEPNDDILLSDKSVDLILSDANLIYTDSKDIEKTLKELVRVARRYIVLCEFHEPSRIKRWKLRWKTGYNAHDYKTLLDKLGCYNINIFKIPAEAWKGFPWEKHGYIIVAQII